MHQYHRKFFQCSQEDYYVLVQYQCRLLKFAHCLLSAVYLEFVLSVPFGSKPLNLYSPLCAQLVSELILSNHLLCVQKRVFDYLPPPASQPHPNPAQ